MWFNLLNLFDVDSVILPLFFFKNISIPSHLEF